jgi:hypothetical protein
MRKIVIPNESRQSIKALLLILKGERVRVG